jgi:glycosyltransferase involved in cell wall biosynthesis
MGPSISRARRVIVVPCYNEAERLDEEAFLKLAHAERVELLFVDDGSTDRTPQVLERLAEQADSVRVVGLKANVGKGEAVRLGLRDAIADGASVVGYYDADLATPPDDLLRMLDRLDSDDHLMAVFGSRVARLGSHIERGALRHYTGRVYATMASAALGMTVYDTQCGAKVFRVSEELRGALDKPFLSAWAFDVVLCHRLRSGTDGSVGLPDEAFLEEPLLAWRDVPGSSLALGGTVRAVLDLARIGLGRYLKERRSRSQG